MRNMLVRVALVVLAMLAAPQGRAAAAESKVAAKKEAAVAVAKQWLAVVDEGRLTQAVPGKVLVR